MSSVISGLDDPTTKKRKRIVSWRDMAAGTEQVVVVVKEKEAEDEAAAAMEQETKKLNDNGAAALNPSFISISTKPFVTHPEGRGGSGRGIALKTKPPPPPLCSSMMTVSIVQILSPRHPPLPPLSQPPPPPPPPVLASSPPPSSPPPNVKSPRNGGGLENEFQGRRNRSNVEILGLVAERRLKSDPAASLLVVDEVLTRWRPWGAMKWWTYLQSTRAFSTVALSSCLGAGSMGSGSGVDDEEEAEEEEAAAVEVGEEKKKKKEAEEKYSQDFKSSSSIAAFHGEKANKGKKLSVIVEGEDEEEEEAVKEEKRELVTTTTTSTSTRSIAHIGIKSGEDGGGGGGCGRGGGLVCYIMRGISGSGKSWHARTLRDAFVKAEITRILANPPAALDDCENQNEGSFSFLLKRRRRQQHKNNNNNKIRMRDMVIVAKRRVRIFSSHDGCMVDGYYVRDESRRRRVLVKESLVKIKCAMETQKHSLIIVDECHAQTWEMEPIVSIALRHGYHVEFVYPPSVPSLIQCTERNIHGTTLAENQLLLSLFDPPAVVSVASVQAALKPRLALHFR